MSLRQRENGRETETEADHATKKGHKGDRRKRGGHRAHRTRAHSTGASQNDHNLLPRQTAVDETKATNSEGVCHIQRASKLISRVEIRTADSITASLYF